MEAREREEIGRFVKKMVTEKLERWVIFSVFFSLLPFFGNLLIEMSKDHQITLGIVFGNRAEILLVGIALCGVGLGELFGAAASPTSTHPLLTYIFGGLSLAIICLGSLYYASIPGNTEFKPHLIMSISIWGFIFSAIASTGCIVIAAYAEGKHLQQLITAAKIAEIGQTIS